MEDDNVELDTYWIQEFEKIDKDYKNFYVENVESIKIYFIYVDKFKNIVNTKKEFFFLKNNTISKNDVIEILKKADNRYFLSSILVFNINIEPNNIKSFISNTQDYTSCFLKDIKHISNISFSKSCHIFQDLNDLFFIFYEKTHNNTKKVYISHGNKTLPLSRTHKNSICYNSL
jgi:hypothetical protein